MLSGTPGGLCVRQLEQAGVADRRPPASIVRRPSFGCGPATSPEGRAWHALLESASDTFREPLSQWADRQGAARCWPSAAGVDRARPERSVLGLETGVSSSMSRGSGDRAAMTCPDSLRQAHHRGLRQHGDVRRQGHVRPHGGGRGGLRHRPEKRQRVRQGTYFTLQFEQDKRTRSVSFNTDPREYKDLDEYRESWEGIASSIYAIAIPRIADVMAAKCVLGRRSGLAP